MPQNDFLLSLGSLQEIGGGKIYLATLMKISTASHIY